MLECPGGKNNSIVSVKLNAFISVKIVLCSSASSKLYFKQKKNMLIMFAMNKSLISLQNTWITIICNIFFFFQIPQSRFLHTKVFKLHRRWIKQKKGSFVYIRNIKSLETN